MSKNAKYPPNKANYKINHQRFNKKRNIYKINKNWQETQMFKDLVKDQSSHLVYLNIK